MSVAQRVNHAWRVLATGISFATFGIGGLLLSVTLFPLAALTSPDAMTTKRRIQRLMHYSWRLFIWFMKSMGILSWELHGGERLRQPGQLIVANHPCLLDVVFLISFIPEVDCVVKPAIFTNRFMRGPARWAGYIAERAPEQLIQDCAATLQAGNSLLIFPEGTRTVPGRAITMRRGAAQMALAARCDLLPVTIQVSPPTLTKGEPWYRVPPRPFHVAVNVGAPLPTERYREQPPALAARHLTLDLERYFTDALRRQAPDGQSAAAALAV
jgi:1-acyl-sn-glycerol-3-phosphate acyltransferase